MPFRMEKEKTASTPYILIDEENNYMRLEGESFHENVIDFFREINTWLQKFLETDFEVFTFECELRYFNSSTAKILFKFLLDMDSAPNAANITVNWIVTANNDIILECGEDFEEEMNNLEFNLIVKEL